MYEGEKTAEQPQESLVTRVSSIDQRLKGLCEQFDKLNQRFNDLCSRIGLKV